MSPAGHNSWVEIAEAAYAANLAFFRRLVGPAVELAAVVKANAYGHGWRLVADLAVRHGADSFCVHSVDEALALRQAGFSQEVLVMGPVPRPRLAEAVAAGLRLVLYDRESVGAMAEAAAGVGRRVKVHLKLETGTHRQGVDAAELEPLLAALADHPELQVEGAYTHFADIEDTTDHRYAAEQLERFRELSGRVEAAGFAPLLRHAACSAATLLFPATHFGMVRLGIAQYGIWPSRETLVAYQLRQGEGNGGVLRPVLTWKARIGQLKEVPAGSFVGYGRSYRTTRPTRLAVLPVGYAEGYDRHLSNRAHVLVGGQRAPVRGRVCMNLTMVDVSDVAGVRSGDEAVLLGLQGEEEVSAEDLAGWIGTIPYEVVSRIRPEIPRLLG